MDSLRFKADWLMHWRLNLLTLSLFLPAGSLLAQTQVPRGTTNSGQAAPKPMVPPPLPSQSPRSQAQGKVGTSAEETLNSGPAPSGNPGGKGPAGKAIKSIKKKKRKETSDSIVKKRGVASPGYVLVGDAQLLPAKVLRFRYILQNVTGNQGFDSKGKAYDVGATLNAAGHAFAMEYGITDRLSLQFIVPVVGANNLAIDANKFRQSDEFEEEYQNLVEAVTPALEARGLCSGVAGCRSAIDGGLALGVDTPVELPTGEIVTIAANVPLKEAADSVILKAVEPASGKTGLGDVTVGFGYSVFSSPRQIVTLGLGVRLPTGEFTNVPAAYRAPGSGFTTLGLVARYDLRIFNPLMLSISNQTEHHLTSAVRNRSSILNSTELNTADPTVDDPAIAGEGDGIANDAPIVRKGVLNSGSVKVSFALGSIARFLNPVAIYGAYGWKIDPAYERENDDDSYREKSELYTASYAVAIDGLGLQPRIPLNISFQRDTPIAGKNVLVAPNLDIYQFILYYKF